MVTSSIQNDLSQPNLGSETLKQSSDPMNVGVFAEAYQAAKAEAEVGDVEHVNRINELSGVINMDPLATVNPAGGPTDPDLVAASQGIPLGGVGSVHQALIEDLQQADVNGTGLLSSAELVFLADVLLGNGDGVVSAAEREALTAKLLALPQDNTLVRSALDILEGIRLQEQGDTAGTALIAHRDNLEVLTLNLPFADTNGTGVFNSAELVALADTDRNGVVSPAEREALTAALRELPPSELVNSGLTILERIRRQELGDPDAIGTNLITAIDSLDSNRKTLNGLKALRDNIAQTPGSGINSVDAQIEAVEFRISFVEQWLSRLNSILNEGS